MSDNPLIATPTSTRTAWTGLSLAESFQGVYQAVNSGSWVNQLLAGGAFAAEVVSTILDPFSALLANGLGWAMEYFEPLREMLDQLAGNPDQVTAHAETWNNISGELSSIASDLQDGLASDIPDWQGDAATSYHMMMINNVDALGGLSVLA